jgi:hypothetical protein
MMFRAQKKPLFWMKRAITEEAQGSSFDAVPLFKRRVALFPATPAGCRP